MIEEVSLGSASSRTDLIAAYLEAGIRRYLVECVRQLVDIDFEQMYPLRILSLTPSIRSWNLLPLYKEIMKP